MCCEKARYCWDFVHIQHFGLSHLTIHNTENMPTNSHYNSGTTPKAPISATQEVLFEMFFFFKSWLVCSNIYIYIVRISLGGSVDLHSSKSLSASEQIYAFFMLRGPARTLFDVGCGVFICI